MNPGRASGADERFVAWYVREFPRVRRTVSVAVGDAGLGEEATSEAFARALSRWPAVSAMQDPTAWVRTVALNEVRSRLRRLRLERRYRVRLTEQHAPPPPEPHPALWAAVAALPPRAREAIALRYVADLTEVQVAAAMGISRGAVASTLSRARQQLARALTDAGADVREDGRVAGPADRDPAAALVTGDGTGGAR